MNVLAINRVFFWNMGERAGVPSMYLPMKRLVDSGHRVHYLYPADNRSKNPELIDGIYVYRYSLPFGLTGEESVSNPGGTSIFHKLLRSVLGNLRWLLFNLFGAIEGFKIARSVQADIIYAHTEQTALIAYALSRLLSVPFVVRIYGLGGLYWQLNSLSAKIKNSRALLAFKLPADKFIIINDGNKSHLVAQSMGVPEHKIACWRNGVDLNIYNPEAGLKLRVRSRLRIRPSSAIILCACRLDPLKRVDRLLDCLPALYKKEQDSVCVIAGDGCERARLEKICRDSAIKERVIFTGCLPRDQMIDLHNAADIFVALSDYSNCGNSLWEAMACAKCIVTLDNNQGTSQVIKSGHNGILIAPEGLGGLPSLLYDLLRNEQERKELGINARESVRNLLESWDRRVEKEVELIEQVAKNKTRQRKEAKVAIQGNL